MPSYKELLAQRDALERLIKDVRAAELSEAVAQARSLVAEYGLTQSDVFTSKAARASKGVGYVAPKYRDPETGATWTGRGKPPLWIADKDRSQYAV